MIISEFNVADVEEVVVEDTWVVDDATVVMVIADDDDAKVDAVVESLPVSDVEVEEGGNWDDVRLWARLSLKIFVLVATSGVDVIDVVVVVVLLEFEVCVVNNS